MISVESCRIGAEERAKKSTGFGVPRPKDPADGCSTGILVLALAFRELYPETLLRVSQQAVSPAGTWQPKPLQVSLACQPGMRTSAGTRLASTYPRWSFKAMRVEFYRSLPQPSRIHLVQRPGGKGGRAD
jgi:hypothetical protein